MPDLPSPCKLCGKREFNHVCFRPNTRSGAKPDGRETVPDRTSQSGDRSERRPTEKPQQVAPVSEPTGKLGPNAEDASGSLAPNRKRAPKGTFDKKAYQRELMKRRRAEGKA